MTRPVPGLILRNRAARRTPPAGGPLIPSGNYAARRSQNFVLTNKRRQGMIELTR